MGCCASCSSGTNSTCEGHSGMGCCNVGPVVAFERMVLTSEGAGASQLDSPIFKVQGEDLNFQGMIHNISGTAATLTLELWVSVDGKYWTQLGGSPNRNSFGPLPPGVNNNVQAIYFFIRAILTTSTGTGVCEFSVSWTGFDS